MLILGLVLLGVLFVAMLARSQSRRFPPARPPAKPVTEGKAHRRKLDDDNDELMIVEELEARD